MTSSFARKALLQTLGHLRRGCLDIVDGAETYRFGDRGGDLRATVVVHNEPASTSPGSLRWPGRRGRRIYGWRLVFAQSGCRDSP